MKIGFVLAFIVSCGPIAVSFADEAPQSGAAIRPNPLIEAKNKIPALEERERLRIDYYKPIYFLYGNPSSKLQFSFRAPLSEDIPINFAYSQIIFWNLLEDSKPFLDATYNPEFFYRMKGPDGFESIDFGIWEHNSNGKAGLASRTYNQSYVRGNYAFQGHRWITKTSLKLKYLYDDEENNHDIYDYISPVEFEIKFLQLFDSWFDESELSANLRPGGRYAQNFNKGGYEIGLSFRFGGLKIIPAFYLQYFEGYGETLLNYNQRVQEFRGGFKF